LITSYVHVFMQVVALTAGRLYTKLGADAALGQLLLPLLAVYLTNSPFCSAEMAGALVCALEGMAAAAVKHSDGAWVYTQSVQLLLKLYREPTSVSTACCFFKACDAEAPDLCQGVAPAPKAVPQGLARVYKVMPERVARACVSALLPSRR
jgi:hypothetical protein